MNPHPYYVLYEHYTEHTQFEGSWELAYETFPDKGNAEGWMANSRRAQDAKQHKKLLVGPLKLEV